MKQPKFPIRIFYDGACVVCATEIEHYRRQDRDGKLNVIDISDSKFQAEEYPAYRNQGLGLGLVTQIEAQVSSLGTYRYLACATVVRSDDHPQRLTQYLSIEQIPRCTGFRPLPGMTTCNELQTSALGTDYIALFCPH
jgi:predicted DCC family thiol-disulfide oxidoreductase YuxK